jgi:hypothetical protein
MGEVFTPDEAAVAERVLREHTRTIPNAELVEEIGLEIIIHRQGRR